MTFTARQAKSDQMVIQRVQSMVRCAQFARPANTTDYAAGDVITSDPAAVISFPSMVERIGGSGIIRQAQLRQGAAQATKLNADLFLFAATALSAIDADNAAWTPTDADLDECVGVIYFDGTAAKIGDATAGDGGNVIIQASGLNIPFLCDADSVDLIGLLIARNAYTPVSGEVFRIMLQADLD